MRRSVFPEPAGGLDENGAERIEGADALLLIGRLGLGLRGGFTHRRPPRLLFSLKQSAIFRNPANCLQAAGLAGFRVVARIHFCAPDEEVLGEFFDLVPPTIELLGREGILDERGACAEAGQERGAGVAHEACEALIFSSADLGEDEPAEHFTGTACARGVERELDIVRPRQRPGIGRNKAGLVVNDKKGIVVKAVGAVEADIEAE